MSAVSPGRPGSKIYPSSPLGQHIPGIATGRDVDWEPLVDYRRNEVSETTIHGAVAWASGGKVVHSFGGNVLCYGRSMMKPFTMQAFIDELDGCTWAQKAISVASHNGDTEHVQAAQSLLSKSEQGLMRTPLDVPLRLEGEHVGSEGRKVFSKGRMWHGDVLLCEAEGLFVRPKDTSLFSSLARRDA